jgi:hypothetical protein
MAQRPRDDIWIEGERGRFDRFSHLEISTDLFGEAQCTFSVADDRAWRTLRDLLAPGRDYRVLCNGLVQFVGRVDCDELPTTVDDGTTIQVVLRTRLADTRVGTADPKVRVENTTIKKFILDLYAAHGFVEEDFLFVSDVDRDLVTGRKAGRPAPVDLEPLQADKAKVQPTETTEAAAKRHLERHHLMLWEGGSGLICVGIPNDQQPPFYRFEQRRGVCNFRDARPVRDWGDVPSSIRVYGGNIGGSLARASVVGIARDPDLVTAGRGVHFRRPVVLNVQGIKDVARAQAQARRELAMRSRRKAAWEIRCDDWTFWDGSRSTPFAIATTADVDVETHDGTDLRGQFLVTSVRKSYTIDEGAQASLTLLQQGLINP